LELGYRSAADNQAPKKEHSLKIGISMGSQAKIDVFNVQIRLIGLKISSLTAHRHENQIRLPLIHYLKSMPL
jgi:hypothetical protein